MALCENKSSCKTYENEFDLRENEPVRKTHFHEWFRTKTRFDTEAKGNSEIAYSNR